MSDSEQQAAAQVESIVELMAALATAEDADDQDAIEQAREAIEQNALSLQVRGDWHTPGAEDGADAVEFELLLCTGGPAVRIVGDLDNGQPSRPRVQHQSWGTPWTEHFLTTDEARNAVLRYCEAHYFGE